MIKIPPKSQLAFAFAYGAAKANNLSRDEMIDFFINQFTIREFAEQYIDAMEFAEENQPQNQHKQARKDFDKAMEVVWKELDSRHKN